MADQCIVCLESLDTESSVAAAPLHPSKANTSSDPSVPQQQPEAAEAESVAPAAVITSTSINIDNLPIKQDNDNHVAQIQVCSHVLHDSCLREWSEKANSCPICRQTFNVVNVYDKLGGKLSPIPLPPFVWEQRPRWCTLETRIANSWIFTGTLVDTRVVQDKKQVAEFDIQAWADENIVEEEVQIPCPVCNLADHEEVLLLCDGCDTPYHTHCIGLDDVPLGSWFCMECVDALGIENQARPDTPSHNQESSGRLYYFPRTQASMRRARQRARSDEWQGAWGRIAGRIWDMLGVDLDYQDDDDTGMFEGLRRSQQLREQERIEHERWQQRLNIASRVGAREVFARNIPTVLQGRPVPASRPPPQEPREVQMAWGAFEKARDMENRKRKSRSGTAEPSEPQPEPERKLKRPRTRRIPPQNGESSLSAANAAGSSSNQADNTGSAASPSASSAADAAPSFLSSLLKEVEMSAPSDEESIRALYGHIPGANDISSPVGSPSRASSITPPPNHSTRPSSPQMTLSSHIEPIYPPANYSPTRASSANKPSRSSSPYKRGVRENRSSPETSDSEHRGRQNGTSELRQPRPRRAAPIVVPKTENVSPSTSPLPLEVKENISNIVRTALHPHWKSSQLTTDQYIAINREISRKIYDQVHDPTAIGEEARHNWESLAKIEVDRAVAGLKA